MEKKIKDDIGTSEERKTPIRAAIGECFEKEKKDLLYSSSLVNVNTHYVGKKNIMNIYIIYSLRSVI